MNPIVLVAAAVITLALVFYSIGVFGERKAGVLGKRHLLFFWLGFACDTTGTTIMSFIANGSAVTGLSLHMVSGIIAIGLMLFHAVWATVVLIRRDQKWLRAFHRLSIVVWLFWLIPYTMGMLIGIPVLHVSDTVLATVSIALAVTLGIFFCVKANLVRRASGTDVQRDA